jgi:hypothetical protein
VITAEQIIEALGTEPKNTRQNWPLIQAALKENGMGSIENELAVLGTLWVEVGRAFAPLTEKRIEGDNLTDYQKKIKGFQDRYWATGYYGRGFLQHTWERNYRWLQEKLGLPLLAKPEMLNDPVVAAKALALWWRENRCHIPAKQRDWAGVRRIVNGAHMLHLNKMQDAIAKLEAIL